MEVRDHPQITKAVETHDATVAKIIRVCIETARRVVNLGFDKYHLILTPVFTLFKPPSTQSEASRWAV